MCSKTSKICASACVFGSFGCLCFLLSLVSIVGYVYFSEDKKYEFLGEVSIYTVLLSFFFMVIASNIREEYKRSPSNTKSTKVTPVNTTDDYP